MKANTDYQHSAFTLSLFKILLPLILLMAATSSRDATAAVINLAPLLNSETNPVSLSPGNTYFLSQEYLLTNSKTVNGNGAALTFGGPIHASGENVSLILDNVKITSSGWAAIAASNGAKGYVQNGSEISCVPGQYGLGNAISVGGSSATPSWASVVNSLISGCSYGMNVGLDASAEIHATSITNTPYAVMVQGPSSSVTIDQQSVLSNTSSGNGVSIYDGASATLRDISVVGFIDGVNIQPTTPGGSAYIYTSLFQNNYSSALNAGNASDVMFSGSRVENAQKDGIFLHTNSRGVIEGSEIIGSLNTGVTFMGCQNGATIRNSYVRGSVHQGISVVALGGVTPIPSRNVLVVNNTIVDSVLPGLLMDGISTAIVQGNVFTSSPGSSSTSPAIYLEGTQGVSLDSSLVTRSPYGMDIHGGSHANILLSFITNNTREALKAYDNATVVNAEHNSVTANNNSGNPAIWSVFTNTGASVEMHNSAIGLSGEKAVFNNAGNLQDFTRNYWDASNGPDLSLIPQTGGSGSFLAWNPGNGSSVAYTPFLTRTPIDSALSQDISLSSGSSLEWVSGIGLVLGLTGKSGITPLAGETMAAMVVQTVDYSGAGRIEPPPDTIDNTLYVAWISSKLRLASASGNMRISLPSVDGTAGLQRRNDDGSWAVVPSVWDPITHVLTYSPQDVHLLNGTFAATLTSVQIRITPSSLSFGYVKPGESKDLSMEVKNIGGGILTGMVSATGSFSIVSGGAYNLGTGQSQQIVVRFTAPLQEGSQTGSLTFTGGGGITIQVKGTNKKAGLPWLLLLLGN